MKKSCFESNGSCLAIRDEKSWLCQVAQVCLQVSFNKDEKYTSVSYQLIGVYLASIFTL